MLRQHNTKLYEHLDKTNHTYVPRIITWPSHPPKPMRPKFAFDFIEMKHKWIKVAASDTIFRKSWRTNQVQDFLYVMHQGLIVFPDTEWFVFFEDDAVFREEKADLTTMLLKYNPTKLREELNIFRAFVRLNKGQGMVAQLFHREFLLSFIGYCSIRFHLVPVDWLLMLFLESNGLRYETSPVLNIFQHRGEQNSFAGNKARKFDKQRRRERL